MYFKIKKRKAKIKPFEKKTSQKWQKFFKFVKVSIYEILEKYKVFKSS